MLNQGYKSWLLIINKTKKHYKKINKYKANNLIYVYICNYAFLFCIVTIIIIIIVIIIIVIIVVSREWLLGCVLYLNQLACCFLLFLYMDECGVFSFSYFCCQFSYCFPINQALNDFNFSSICIELLKKTLYLDDFVYLYSLTHRIQSSVQIVFIQNEQKTKIIKNINK